MPTEIYVKSTNDEGQEVYVPIEKWEGVEIPAEVVRTTDVYKQTLNESVNRRNTIKGLREQLTKLEKEEGETETPEPDKTETTEGLNFKTRTELLEFIRNETMQRDSLEAQNKRDKENKITEIANKHKLASDAVPLLMQVDLAQADVIAQYIGQQKLRFDNTSGGGEQRQLSADNIAEKVAKNLNLFDEK